MYNFTIQCSRSGLPLSDLSFQLQDPNGTLVPPGSSWSISAFDGPGNLAGSYSLTSDQWTSGGSTVVLEGELISLDSGIDRLTGDIFVVIQVGSSEGETAVAIP